MRCPSHLANLLEEAQEMCASQQELRQVVLVVFLSSALAPAKALAVHWSSAEVDLR